MNKRIINIICVHIITLFLGKYAYSFFPEKPTKQERNIYKVGKPIDMEDGK